MIGHRALRVPTAMAQHGFRIAPELASSICADAARAVSTLRALDQHMERHNAWLARAAAELGLDARIDPTAAKDARAKANALFDQLRALRRELVDLTLDAAAATVPPVAAAERAMRAPEPDPLPDAFTRLNFLAVQRTHAHGFSDRSRAATGAVRQVRDRLRRSADPESRALAERAHAFIVEVHGPDDV